MVATSDLWPVAFDPFLRLTGAARPGHPGGALRSVGGVRGLHPRGDGPARGQDHVCGRRPQRHAQARESPLPPPSYSPPFW